ncbi:hypothetical protein Taro_009877 [Colocasia esculenta]|uniref:Uncharacterized protein n=1 Tax=Colocasia esculenta TaxID=4460 RepID=A0A843U1P4_COLES|nr:hypothetical protein [Colocasia esculenta]
MEEIATKLEDLNLCVILIGGVLKPSILMSNENENDGGNDDCCSMPGTPSRLSLSSTPIPRQWAASGGSQEPARHTLWCFASGRKSSPFISPLFPPPPPRFPSSAPSSPSSSQSGVDFSLSFAPSFSCEGMIGDGESPLRPCLCQIARTDVVRNDSYHLTESRFGQEYILQCHQARVEHQLSSSGRGAESSISLGLLAHGSLDTSSPDTYRPPPAPLPYDIDLVCSQTLPQTGNKIDEVPLNESQPLGEKICGSNFEGFMNLESNHKKKSDSEHGSPKVAENKDTKLSVSVISSTEEEDTTTQPTEITRVRNPEKPSKNSLGERCSPNLVKSTSSCASAPSILCHLACRKRGSTLWTLVVVTKQIFLAFHFKKFHLFLQIYVGAAIAAMIKI